MTGLAFYTSTNSWRWRSGKLVPGGDAKWVFIPEAIKFADTWPDTKLVSINCERTKGPKEYLRFLKIRMILRRCDDESLDDVSFYCHGWPTRMQHAINVNNMWKLAEHLGRVLKLGGQVFFNACSMARGPRSPKAGRYNGDATDIEDRCKMSFVVRLQRQLCRLGRQDISVLGHYTSGHATRNPYVIQAGPWYDHGWVVPPAHRLDKRLYKTAGDLDAWYANRPNWLAWVDFLKTNDLKTAVKEFGKK